MVNLTLKQKILLLTLILIIVLLVTVKFLVNYEMEQIRIHQVEALRTDLIKNKKDALRDYVELAVASVQGIYDSASADDLYAQEQALQILTELSYGKQGDGYIFVYKYDCTNLANRPNPKLQGENLLDLKDKNGVHIIQELIAAAKTGGGYVDYVWAKPSQNTPMLAS